MGELQPGQVVDRYEVVRELGSGGMADVYQVRHRALGTVHALKHLTIRSAQLDKRFLLEGRVQATLCHPHIVPVRDVIEAPEGPCLVLDYVEGPDLYELREHFPLTVDEALGISHGLLRALGWAHGRQVVHRDLKPGNVILERRREGLVPRLLDFGLAKILAGPRGSGPRTGTGMMMGTPVYMAPEQMRDAKRVGPAADLFSFGAVLHALLTGAPPWSGRSAIRVIKERRKGSPPRVDVLREEVPAHVADTVARCLAYDPTARPPNAAAILDALGLPVSPLHGEAPPVTGPTLSQWARG